MNNCRRIVDDRYSNFTSEQRFLFDRFVKHFENDPEFSSPTCDPNRLLSLAHIFINIRFLQCSYDEKLMRKVEKMVDSFYETVKNNGGGNRYSESKRKYEPDHQSNNAGTSKKRLETESDNTNKNLLNDFVIMKNTNYNASTQEVKSILNSSASFSRLCLKYVESNIEEDNDDLLQHVCQIFLNYSNNGFQIDKGYLVGYGKGQTKKEAKDVAAELALNFLEHNCYTIVMKNSVDPDRDQIDMDKNLNNSKGDSGSVIGGIGAKLMAKWGWSQGGGLGKEEQGRQEPVQILQRFARHGLGSVLVDKNFNKLVKSIIEEYKKSDEEQDLVFAANLSAEQRKFIHKMAGHFNLKHTSYGSGDRRQLTIQKRKTARELVEYLKANDKETGKYLLIDPKSTVTG